MGTFVNLGDQIERSLTAIGITSDLVSTWLGRPCGCEERKAKLNALGVWANRVTAGRVGNARGYLLGILGLDESPTGTGASS